MASIGAVGQPTGACQFPPPRSGSQSNNLFNDEAESELGRVANYHFEQSHRVLEDPVVNEYLEKVGDKLVASLPSTSLRVHFYVVDLPDANAMGVPGGYVYVSRKLIAFLRSEDELAAILSHEMGHIVTHQSAVEISREMRRVLKIDHIETSEVFDRYNELLENWRRKEQLSVNDKEDEHQVEADRVALYTLIRAGYNPAVWPDLFDRLAETKGRSGTWFSNFFGSISPDSKRLREMIHELAVLPGGCAASAIKSPAGDFKQWQASVIAYRGTGHAESLRGVVLRRKLQPTLRADLKQLRISPDGKSFLAQDEGSVVIFDRKTMKPIFRIPAENAHLAQYAADSRHVSFHVSQLGASPRVETWDIQEQTQEIHEIYERNGCEQTALSPDGKYFACIALSGGGFTGLSFDLRVREVETAGLVVEKQSFFSGAYFSIRSQMTAATISGAADISIAKLAFSPDSHFLLVGRDNVAMAIDLAKGQSVPIDGNLKHIMRSSQFAFLDSQRVVGLEPDGYGQIVSLVDGHILADRLGIGRTGVQPAANADYIVVGPLKDFAAGIFNVKTNKIFFGSKTRALDVYDNVVLRERLDGRIAVVDINEGKEVSLAPMMDTTLGSLDAGSYSGDGRLLALSGGSRGAVWKLDGDKGKFLTIRRFEGAYFDANGSLCGIFPKEGEAKRSAVVADFETQKVNTRSLEEDVRSFQRGRYLIVLRPGKKDEYRKDVTFEVRDVCSNTLLWSRVFSQGIPRYYFDRNAGSLIFLSNVADDFGKSAIKADVHLQQREKELRSKEGLYYLELVAMASGNTGAQMLLDTGKFSFVVTDAFSTKDRLFIRDNSERLLAFSFDGKLVGRAFGPAATVSPDGRYLLVHNARGQLTVFDGKTLEHLQQLDFAEPISWLTFGADPTIMAVITSDQTLFTIDLNVAAKQMSHADAHPQ
jgi:WD40 repeat protein